MTTAVWSIATLGAVGKLVLTGVGRKFWVVVYLVLGWMVVVALKPMIDSLAWYAMALLVTWAMIRKWQMLAAMTSAWKISW